MRKVSMLLGLLCLAIAASPAIAQQAANDARFHDVLRDAATRYREWGRLDLVPGWAPGLCAMPPPRVVMGEPPRMSAAPAGPHGRKLYFLYARDRARYPMHGQWVQHEPPRIGQIVVKEAFAPRAVSADTQGAILDLHGGFFTPGDPMGLYVMALVSTPDDARTDAGWIYGTLTRDGEITSSGRVASCMGCHQSAPEGRLFGMHARHDAWAQRWRDLER